MEMELLIVKQDVSSIIDQFKNRAIEMNLIHYASEAVVEMKFENSKELDDSIKHAMEICSSVGISLDENFKFIYRCSNEGINYDYKLSELAYKLVCLNGQPTNPNVALMQIRLLKDIKLKH